MGAPTLDVGRRAGRRRPTAQRRRVVSLHGNFPRFGAVANDGKRLALCYWPSGPAYVLRKGHAAELLKWLETIPPEWFGGANNEDGAIASWLWSKQEPAYVTIPSLVRHDVTIPSTLPGYDQHPNRQTVIDWNLYPPRPWTAEDVASAPYVPVPWMSDAQLNELGKQLRGIRPRIICCFCAQQEGRYVSHKTGAALCLGCADKVADIHHRSGAALGPASSAQSGAAVP